MRGKPSFERVQVWEREDGILNDNLYLEVTNSGALLAFGLGIHEGRYKAGGTDHGFPWLHLRARSEDQGRTWTLEERQWWEPETRPKRAGVVDRSTGEIFMFNQGSWPLLDDHGDPLSERWITSNYKKGREMGARMVMERSRDDGGSWEKVDLTDQFYTYPGAGIAWFLGAGIQLQRGPHAGRLIVPGLYRPKEIQEIDGEKHNVIHDHAALGLVYDDGDGQISQCLNDEARNMVVYSDDHGESWQWGGSSQGFSAEACIVELSDGEVYMNNRNYDPTSIGYRTWCISRDGGETFTEFGVDETLVEARCHASLTRYVDPAGNDPDRILFSNPPVFEGKWQSPSRGCGNQCRINQSVRVSYDDCKTWPVSRQVDEGGGYSTLVALDDGTILCGFDRNVFRFNMAWLEQGAANG